MQQTLYQTAGSLNPDCDGLTRLLSRVSREPITVEPRRYPVRQMHSRDRRRLELCCVQDDQISGIFGHVDDEAHQSTLVLGGAGRSEHEDDFARQAAVPEIVHQAAAGHKVVFVDPRRASQLWVAVWRTETLYMYRWS